MPVGQILRYSGLAILLAVLAIGPFFRGLFFWTELLAAIAAISLGFTLWLIGRRLDGLASGIPGGWAGAALLALLGAYLLQLAWAVYPRGNLDWVLRVAAAWFAYVMVRAEAGPGLRRWLGWSFVLSAVGVGFVGFLEFTGYFLKDPEMMAALGLVGLQDRMWTSFQYPNTAAAWFLAAIFVAAGLGLDELRKPWKLAAAGGLITFLGLAFFFTVSRGAVLVLPVGLVIFFLGLDRQRRWPALLLLIGTTAAMLPALKGIGANSAIQNHISAFRWVGAATMAGAVGGVVLAYYLRLKLRWQAAIAGGLLLLGVGGLLAMGSPSSLMPKQATRLFDMNFKTQNAQLRLIFMEDAMRIWADHPLGRGGAGWDRSYKQYQAFNYTAQETHSHYAQVAVEAGAPGLLALLAGLALATWAAWRTRAADPVAWPLAAGAILLAGHSMIDFNLSFGAAWLGLWAILGASAAPADALRWDRQALFGGLAGGAGVLVLAGVLFTGHRLTEKAAAAAARKEQAAAVELARQAVRFDPWDSRPWLLIGDAEAVERAARLDPGLAKARWEYALSLERQGDTAGALREAQVALANQPMISAHYTKVASLTGRLMVDALHKGDQARARELAQDLALLGASLEKRRATGEALQHLWQGAKLTMAPEFRLRYGQALFLTGDETGAEPHLVEAGKVGLLGSEAHIWLYAIFERRDDTKAMATLADKPWIRFRGTNPVYQAVRAWR